MELSTRARAHAALGDPRRLSIVDQLVVGDMTVAELGELVGMRGNLLAHHLEVLEEAKLISRRVSEGDHRRRYVSLRWEALPTSIGRGPAPSGDVVFVCTHNSARSQFAAALWQETGRGAARSAGTEPADTVNRKAVRVASEFGLDLSDAVPSGYETLPAEPGLVISVCDRAREAGVPEAKEHLHWSIPDPVLVGTLEAFRNSFEQIRTRVERMSGQVAT